MWPHTHTKIWLLIWHTEMCFRIPITFQILRCSRPTSGEVRRCCTWVHFFANTSEFKQSEQKWMKKHTHLKFIQYLPLHATLHVNTMQMQLMESGDTALIVFGEMSKFFHHYQQGCLHEIHLKQKLWLLPTALLTYCGDASLISFQLKVNIPLYFSPTVMRMQWVNSSRQVRNIHVFIFHSWYRWCAWIEKILCVCVCACVCLPSEGKKGNTDLSYSDWKDKRKVESRCVVPTASLHH